jgi:molybdate transport system regulatory protein
MKISARNSFKGTITALTPGAVNSEIIIDIGGGDVLVAIITNGSAKALNLAVDKDVLAFVKASSVLLMTDGGGVKLSARNALRGIIQSVTPGAVNGEVSLKLSGGAQVHAIVTNEAIKELGLEAAKEAVVVIKASSVILGVAV